MDSVVYNLFFTFAKENGLQVVIDTETGSVSGYVQDLHSDGVFIITPDKVLFAVGYSKINYVGTRTSMSGSINRC